MKKLLIPLFLLISTLGFSQGETKVPLLQLYQSGATTGQIPKWDGTKWAASDDAGVLSGTTGRIATFTSGTTIGNSLIYQDANWQSLDYTAGANKNLILTQGGTAPAGANVGRSNIGFCKSCYTSTGMLANTDENVAVGYSNFTALTGGDYNVAIGSGALQIVTSGTGNMAIGYQALLNDTSGSSNVAIGNSALRLLKNGGQNVGIGTGAGDGITTGSQNVLISSTAGRYLSTGTGNVGIGFQAMNGVFDATIGSSGYTTGGFNTAIGYNSLRRLGNGNYITAIGPSSGWYTSSTAASGSIAIGFESGFYFDKNYVAIGYQALKGTSAAWAPGNYNTAIGYVSLTSLTSGNYNTAIGPYTLQYDTSGSENVAIGYESSLLLRSAGRCVTIGAGAGRGNLTGQIVAIGGDALRSSTGTGLTAIGPGAGQGITSGSSSIAIGTSAMGYGTMTGSENVAIGNEALSEKTSGTGSIGIGHRAGFKWTNSTGNTAIGSESFSAATTSSGLTGIGYRAGLYATGDNNTFIGYLSGQGISGTPLTGSNNTAIGSQAMALIRGAAANNVAIGTQAGFGWTTSSKNVAIGREAVYSDTSSSEIVGIGYRAGFYQMNAQNTFIGAYAGEGVSGSNIYGATYIGYEAGRFINNNNCTYIGNGAGKGASGSSTGDANIGIGVNAFNKITTASTGVAIGNLAGANITSSQANTLIGYTAGNALTTYTGSGQNTLIGAGAGSAGPVMLNCTAIGFYALGGTGTTSTSSDIAIGSYALQLITTGNNNIAIGHDGLKNTSTGVRNTTIGNAAGFTNTTSSENTYIGASAGFYATGGNNTFIGSSSGKGINTVAFTGSNNTAIGFQTLASIRGAASNNGAIGAQALYSMRNANRNYAFGTSALYADTTGSENMAIGHSSLLAITDGNANTAIGDISMYQATGNSSYNVAIGKNSLNGAFNFQRNTALGYLAGSNTSAGRTGGVYIGSGAGYGSTVDGALYIDKNTTPTSNKAPLIGGVFSSLWVGINTLPENLSASLEITSAGNTFSTKTLEFNNSSATNILDLRDNGNMGMSITAQSGNRLAVQQSGSGTQVALLLRNGVDEDGQGIAMDLNNAGIVHGRIVATNPTGGLTSALDIYTPDNSGTLSSFHTMQRDGSQNQLHKAIYYDVYNGTSTTETLTGLVSIVNVPNTATTTTINLPEIVTGVPGANQVNIGYVLELSIDNASAITVQRAGTSDVIMVNGSTSTVTSIATTGGTYYVKRFIAAESNKWIVF